MEEIEEKPTIACKPLSWGFFILAALCFYAGFTDTAILFFIIHIGFSRWANSLRIFD